MYKNEWENLLRKQCPKCGYNLDKIENDYRICQNNNCDFTISRWSFEEQCDRMRREEGKEDLEGYGFE